MLRDLKLLSGPAPLALRWGTVAAIAAVTLVAIGLRPPGGETVSSSTVVAEDKPPASTAAKPNAMPQELTATYVPTDASIVIAVRPTDILKVYQKLAEATPALAVPQGTPNPIELFTGCEQACLSWAHIAPGVSIQNAVGEIHSGKISVVYCFTCTNKDARDVLLKTMSYPGPDWQAKSFATFEYQSKAGESLFLPDDKTLVFGDDEALMQKLMLTGAKSTSPLTQTESWKQASRGTAVIAIDPTLVQTIGAVQRIPQPFAGMFSPLWESASNHTLGLKLDEKLALALTTQAKDAAGAEKIKATLGVGVTMLTNMLTNVKNHPQKEISDLGKVLSTSLEKHQLAVEGKQVTLSMTSDVNALLPLAVQAITQAREAAQRTQQQHNLRQVLLGMHNYHDANGYFPPAVVIDKASGVPHSWRVEILPYLDQALLYNQYKLNEPWDSEANKKVLALMPAPYRHPSQGDSTNTSIYAAYGDGYVFQKDDKEGTKISDILDGTSNTLAVFEAQGDIPWTKPEELTIDLSNGVPANFGFTPDGFFAGFGDGSVRFISPSIDKDVLEALFTRAGGAGK